MRRICAWCGKVLGEKEPFNDNSTTHSICKDCLAKANKEFDAIEQREKSGREDVGRKSVEN